MTLHTITVARLRELLEDQSPDARVIVSTDYGDRQHTAQALPLRGELDTVAITESGYSNSGFAIAEPDDEDYNDNNTFLVLR